MPSAPSRAQAAAPMADATSRVDYAPSGMPRLGAWIRDVEPGSPADDAGILPGMRVDAAEGRELPDIIEWLWIASDDSVEVAVFDPRDGTTSAATLVRDPGQSWGIEFDDVVFDGIRTCANACAFCFMGMLPEGMRSSLSLRDDDYRLSFLQGNFVTLTNVSDEDLERIVSHRLEPMNVSLHAVGSEARRRLIGANEGRGMRAIERLCEEGLEIHAQIVCCPSVNDADELGRTLDWVEARPNVTSLAVVPLGYTRFSPRFSRSFSDDEAAAAQVIDQVRPYQVRSRRACGRTRFQLSDEFYLAAGREVPPAAEYDGFPQFYDGIGMIRSFLDDTGRVARERAGELHALTERLARSHAPVLLVCGVAARGCVAHLVEAWGIGRCSRVFPVENRFFGGNVDVTGLITATDLLDQLPADLQGGIVLLPDVMFNSDGITLDGTARDDLGARISLRGGSLLVCGNSPGELLEALLAAERLGGAPAGHGRLDGKTRGSEESHG